MRAKYTGKICDSNISTILTADICDSNISAIVTADMCDSNTSTILTADICDSNIPIILAGEMRLFMKNLWGKLVALIKWCWNSAVMRYIFFGGLTTMVNLVCFYTLRICTPMNRELANWIAVMISILFAYVVNSIWVFESKVRGFAARIIELGKFIGARASTMVIEVGGVWFMAEILHINDLVGKLIIQFVVLVLNYVFSKFLVLTGKKEKRKD